MTSYKLKVLCDVFWTVRVKFLSLAAGAVLISASPVIAVLAQLPMPAPLEPPAALVHEAFASAYGRALVAELGKALHASADPACLSSKAIAPDQLQQRGGEFVDKWGTRAMETVSSLIDLKVYEDKLAASAGTDASAELMRLRQDNAVKRYLAIERPIKLTRVLDFIFEQFDRYVLIARIKLAPVFPLASGNEELLRRDPTDAAEKQAKKFIAASKSAALRRFLTLSEQAIAAMTGAIKPEPGRTAGPGTFFRGIETDLSELCIRADR